MATNNYFAYSGAQYAQTAAGYPAAQPGYGVHTAVAAGTAVPGAAYDSSFQTSGTPVTYSAPPTVGVTYDATKTFYQQASAVGANSSTPDYSAWQQANYQARQANAAAVANVTNNKSYSVPAVQQATANAAYIPAIAGAAYNYQNVQATTNGTKQSVATISQPPKKAVANPGSVAQNAALAASAYPAIPGAVYPNANMAYTNPYDQVLISAATSMYMNQNPKSIAKGANYKLRPGLGSSKIFRPIKPQQLHYCDACKISCAGPSAYHDHLQGQKHKKKVAKTTTEQQQLPKKTVLSKNVHTYVCQLCDIECTSADAYAAHLRGSKHDKVVKLHTKLGKPIPIPDPKIDAAILARNIQEEATKNLGITGSVIPAPPLPPVTRTAAPRINFVAAGNNVASMPLNNAALVTAVPVVENQLCAAPNESGPSALGFVVDDRPVVGSEYIEEERDMTGKLISFNCKLCDCKFSDPNAKEMHMKGRKHRLQFKKKVDPKLKVEMKPNTFKQKKNEKLKKHLEKPQGIIKKKDMRYGDEGNDYFDWGWKPPGMPGMMGPRYPMMRSQRGMMMGHGSRMPMPPQGGPQMYPYGGSAMSPFSRKPPETQEDRYIMAKHRDIYPSDSEVNNVQKHINYIEKALKLVSDRLLQDAERKIAAANNANKSDDEQASENVPPQTAIRELTGVLRVGAFAKGLLLSGDTDVDLVMLCANKPTLSLLMKMVLLLPDQLKEVASGNEYSILPHPDDAALSITAVPKESETKSLKVNVTLTSPVVREEILAVNDEAVPADGSKVSKEIIPDPPDVLNKAKCLDALAALRHAKWFQARAAPSQNCMIIIRILKDLSRRDVAWGQLDSWAMELLCEKIISSSTPPLSVGECLRRIFECIASGILFPDGPGLADPCEKEPVDIFSCMTTQQREYITAFTQHALRLVAFRQIHKILGMEILPPVSKFGKKPINRKRRLDGGPNEGVKKERKDVQLDGGQTMKIETNI